jgi:spore coat protein CotH
MANPQADVYVPATLTYDGIVVPQVGLRFKGNSSRNSVAMMGSERFSLKIDIDEYVDGQDLLGVDKLNFNNGFKDPSYLREYMGSVLYRALDVPAPRAAFIRLTRNGLAFGLYSVVEQVDKDFLRAHFDSDEGDLYKPEQPASDLTWRGDQASAYESMEIKTNEDTTDHSALVHFLDVLNNTPDNQLETSLPEVLDVDLALRYLAVTTALVSLDSYTGGLAHNYYIYEQEGVFSMITWDMNETYGNFTCGQSSSQVLALAIDQPICGAVTSRPLAMRLLGVPSLQARYHELLLELIDGVWTTELVTTEVDRMADLIRADVAADPSRFYPANAFDINIHDDWLQGMMTTFGLTSFVTRRAESIAAQLP